MIHIIDYGMGNIGSVQNMLKKIGAKTVITSKPKELEKAEKLILPGVGAFDQGMRNITDRDLIDVIQNKVQVQKIPFLGICLGAQLIMRRSEEGRLSGFGWIDGEVVRFQFPNDNDRLKIPYMGWNEVDIKNDNRLFCNFEEIPRFYFVHSYYIRCENKINVIASSQYGFEFAAAVNKENIWGVQFHPEKSHQFGLKVLKNFVELC